jgi:hypothetical protein
MKRLLTPLLVLFALVWTGPAMAAVQIHFQSFTGSMFIGRYPHTFIVLEGTLGNGRRVNENYGFSAREATPAVLQGPVEHMMLTETANNIKKTNRHFSMTITDAQYRRIVTEVRKWQKMPGKYYDLEKRNCIHFVGKMAQIVGLKVEYPKSMLRKPKEWLNYIADLNPRLNAKKI